MDLSSEVLHHWQSLKFKYENSNVAQHADYLRSMLNTFRFAEAIMCKDVQRSLMKQYLSEYAMIVDSSDPSIGLNNYAEGALKLAEHQKSECQEWKSTIDLKKLMIKESVRTFLHAAGDYKPIENDEGFMKSLKIKKPLLNFQPKSCIEAPVENFKNKQFSGILSSSTGNSSDPFTCTEVNFNKQNQQPPQPMKARLNTTLSIQNLERPELGNSGVNSIHERPKIEEFANNKVGTFRTAKDQLIIESNKKAVNRGQCVSSTSYGTLKKSLGTRRGPNSRFIPPVLSKDNHCEEFGHHESRAAEEFMDDRLKNIDPKMVELIQNEIMDQGPPISWEDIAGLEFAKSTIKEIVVWPMLRPDIFTGLRGPPKGLLLFGPPGTGKTLIGKCIASQSKATFFSISASSLTSKWIGEGEKMVRALFAVARCHQPSVIFIDEIDSLLTQRSDTEHESSRRIKTEFLVQLDGATTSNDERLLVIGATNRPQELDEAARRRLVKRLYIPLPELPARYQIIMNLLSKQHHNLIDGQIQDICIKTEGYSGADMTNLCREAALGPIRSISFDSIQHITLDEVRPINYSDFLNALCQVRASVSDRDLNTYMEWNEKFGSGTK